MDLHVRRGNDGHRLHGAGDDVDLVNRFLAHLSARGFSLATVRAYAFDILNFLRFCAQRELGLSSVAPGDLFDYLDWQTRQAPTVVQKVVRIDRRRGRHHEPAYRRGARHVRVPAGRRGAGRQPGSRRAALLGPAGAKAGAARSPWPRPTPCGRAVGASTAPPARGPGAGGCEQLLADLRTCRDRAIVLAMVLGGLRSAEVRSLRLSDVDIGLRRLRVVGKGGKERVVPVDGAFFAECAAYLRGERPAGCRTPECFVVLRGPSTGQAMTEAGLRSLFRNHRASSGATRVRPHRLRHTYGTELATAGMDLLVLRELMGHASPETTAGYVNPREMHQMGENPLVAC